MVSRAVNEAQEELVACQDSDLAIIYDRMSLLLYLEHLDRLGPGEEAEEVIIPWIGRLIHSDQVKANLLGTMACQLPSIKEAEDISILFTNSIHKLVESSDGGKIRMGLELSIQIVSASNWQLLEKPLIRSLRSRYGSIRKRAWVAFSRLLTLKDHHGETLVLADLIKKDEDDLDVLCAAINCLGKHFSLFETESLQIWTQGLQEKLLESSEVHLVLQCQLLKLSDKLGNQMDVLTTLKRLLSKHKDCKPVLLQIYKTLAMKKLDIEGLGEFISQSPVELCFIECLARCNPKAILHFQQFLLDSMEDDDPFVRLKALRILSLSATKQSWNRINETVKSLIAIGEVCLEAVSIGFDLIDKFGSDETIRIKLALLDLAPESIGELEYESIQLEGEQFDYSPGHHSLLYDLVVISHCNDRNILDMLHSKYHHDPFICRLIEGKTGHVKGESLIDQFYSSGSEDEEALEASEALEALDEEESHEHEEPKSYAASNESIVPDLSKVKITSDLFQGLLDTI